MTAAIFDKQSSVPIRAMFVGQRIDVRTFEQTQRLTNAPLTVAAGEQGIVVLFRYGVLVMAGMQAAEMLAFSNQIAHLINDPFAAPEWEEVELVRDPHANEGIIQDKILLQDFNLERIQTVADVLAKSVVLAHYEVALAKHFDLIEPLAASLKQARRPGPKGRELLNHLGDTLMIESKMIGRVEVSEKPELLWEHPQYERLYLRLEDEYELEERRKAIERKLELISRTASTLLDLLQHRRSLRVEWYIVILIVIDIVISMVEKAI
jgi:uncharacterized Rmd1/YagE family protein